MAVKLNVLNEARKETLSGLKLVTETFRPPETGAHLEIGEKLQLRITITNIIEKGGGGGSRGDAHFKNISVRVTKSEFVKFLAGPKGPALEDKKKWYRLIQGDQTLAEGVPVWKWVWFEAIKESPDELTPELIANVKVWGEFDLERYFTSNKGSPVYHDIHD